MTGVQKTVGYKIILLPAVLFTYYTLTYMSSMINTGMEFPQETFMAI